MIIDFTNLIFACSAAMDAIEAEFLGVALGHGKRVAYLTMKMMNASNCSKRHITDVSLVALLHDNGLIPYIREEHDMHDVLDETLNFPKTVENIHKNLEIEAGMGHSTEGEKNIRKLPFKTDIHNIILYHHENADGSGPIGADFTKTSLESEVIHLADLIDVEFPFQSPAEYIYDNAKIFVENNIGKLFTKRAATLFEKIWSVNVIMEAQENGVENFLKKSMLPDERNFSDEEVFSIADFFAQLVDYKSSFTKTHSMGVAQKAKKMAQFYNWQHEKVIRYYFAGALHDIGKMIIPNDILEKPDRLTKEEFGSMQNHAQATRHILSKIQGFEDITNWAANHHEKLDGSGYSLGLKGKDLSKEERLMACIDIYQALTEKRPYKEGLSHKKAIELMKSMAKDGKIDPEIVNDMNAAFYVEGQTGDENHKKATKKWKCPVCGYIEEGEYPPAKCPVCGASGYRFEPLK